MTQTEHVLGVYGPGCGSGPWTPRETRILQFGAGAGLTGGVHARLGRERTASRQGAGQAGEGAPTGGTAAHRAPDHRAQPARPLPARGWYAQVSTAGQRFLGAFSSLWATSELLGSAW